MKINQGIKYLNVITHLKNKLLLHSMMVGLALVLIIMPKEVMAISIDGNVQGFSEGYSTGYNVSFSLDDGSIINGGKLFVNETSTLISVGFIAPLTLNDNTYGANKASDWNINHFLMGGGDGLEGSDKWKFDLVVDNGVDVTVELDYIKHLGSDIFSADIRRFKQEKNEVDAQVSFATSLHYNYHTLGYTQFFDSDKGNPVDSPFANDGMYDFVSAVDWVPEIMYEFSLDKSAFTGIGTLNISETLLNLGELHMSPNKLAGHVVTINSLTLISDPEPVPEPATIALLGIGLAGAGGRYLRRRFKNGK